MKYLILGAGPAGLTLANKFKQNGITDFCFSLCRKKNGINMNATAEL